MDRPGLFAMLALVGLSAAAQAAAPRFDPAAIEFFEKRIRPLLVENCYTCHSADTNSKGGLRVDDRNGLLHGGERGAAVVAGKPQESLLIRAVGYGDEELQMPPMKRLSAEQVADLSKWIEDGAAWPEVPLPPDLGAPNPQYDQLRKEHWAWQPIRATRVPAVRNVDWPRSDIDTFLLAKLEEQQLQPVGDADRSVLIRRASYDLTGLPPTPAQIDAFVADSSATAFEKLVDRLLASPAFGERWGRHWLDVARYGESTGSSRNVPLPHAWRYRDYVIAAFNGDKPYDRFIREQIAGDLLPADSAEARDELLIATGFLALGVKDVNQRFKVRFLMDNIDEQIDTVSRSVLALTTSCARCHDHKFDPIPTSDYYALAGIFSSTDLCAGLRNKMGGGGFDFYDTQMLLRLGASSPAAGPDAESVKKIEEIKTSLAAARAEFEKLRLSPEGSEPGPDGRPKRAIARQKMTRLENELFAYTDPAANGPVAFGVREAKTIGDTEIRVRGEAEKLGPVVPRGFLSVVQVPGAPQIDAARSGRLELAQWLTSEHNPLVSRVAVNRVWQHLFGQGLVKSVDNFGVNGDRPSHEELLDYLAGSFVRDGWSIKRLIRTLMLSRAYQLDSESRDDNMRVDPANRLVWRHAPRRLDAEELRDTMLWVAGNLDGQRPAASPAQSLKVVELPNNAAEAKRIATASMSSKHRSVYLPLLRGLTPRPLEVFDFAEQGMVTGHRDTTTVATQSLYLLNDPLVRRQSLAFAERLLARGDIEEAERVSAAYRLSLGRAANDREISRALRYLADYENAVQGDAPQPMNADTPAVLATAEQGAAAGGSGNESTQPAKTPKKKAAPQNPDDIDRTEQAVEEEVLRPASARVAAWASFCQALLGSAEFRYLK